MNMNGRPVSNRKKVQLLVALTILAWATQTLLQQWAHGEEAPPAANGAQTSEQFVPNGGGVDVGATLEVRAEATVHGGDIQLRQICRWSDADAKFFSPISDLTIARFQGKAPFESVSIEQIRQTLHDAGANLGVIRLSGSTACTVTRSDINYDESDALQQWADAREGKVKAAAPLETLAAQLPVSAPSTRPLPIDPADATPAAAEPVHTLRDRIVSDASVRLGVPADLLQINFNPADDHFLNLAEPQFRFNIEARRVYGLGDVAWDVLVVTDNGNNKKVPILATARAWQKQVMLVRPVAFKQIIQNDDVTEKRILIDHLSDDPLLALGQCVGQEASRDLKPGTVVTAKMVNPVDLAKPGQFVTVTMVSGSVHIKTVGRALEAGAFGQTVKVKNEATGATYEVVLTGQQEGTISPP